MPEANKRSRRNSVSAKREATVGPAVKDGFHAVVVTGPKLGRWRAGRQFDATPVTIELAELNADELAAIEADPSLSVSFEAAAQAA